MNDRTLKELKIVVERAVRTVRATMARKRRMREELLSHLVAIFDEEAAQLADDQAALAMAKRRFGDPRELTPQLQQSVPRWDRCRAILENLGCQPDESAWHLAAKHSLAMLALYSAPMLAIAAMLLLGRAPNIGPLESQRILVRAILLGLPALALFNAILSLISASLLNRIGRALASRRWGRILLALLCVVAAPCGWILFPLAGAVLLFILMVLQAVKQWRYQADWT